MTKINSDTPSINNYSTQRLLATQVLAGFSQWIDIFLIFSVPAFLWQSTPPQMAFIAACFGLPGLFLGPFIGAMLDELDPKRVAFIGALARTALTISISLTNGFELFSALVMLKGLANVFYWPATSILTQRIVAPVERIKFFSSLSALDQITKILTPMIAGALILLMDMQLAFLLSAAMTLLCALIITRLPASALEIPQKEISLHGWRGFIAGWKMMIALPSVLTSSISLGVGMSISLAIYDPHVAAYLNALKFEPGTFSLLVSSTAAGAVCGALLIRFLGKNASSTQFIQTGIALFFVAITSIAVLSTYHVQAINAPVIALIWFISGIGYEIFLIGSSVTLQNLCPPHLLGRVVTSARSLQLLAVVTGPMIGAWLISEQSRATPFAVSAFIVCLLLLASMRCFPRRRP